MVGITSTFILAMLGNRRFFIDWEIHIEDMDVYPRATSQFKEEMAKMLHIDLEDYFNLPCFDWSMNPATPLHIGEACEPVKRNRALRVRLGPQWTSEWSRLSTDPVPDILNGTCVYLTGYESVGEKLARNPHYRSFIHSLDIFGDSSSWVLDSMVSRFLFQPNEEMAGLLEDLKDLVWQPTKRLVDFR